MDFSWRANIGKNTEKIDKTPKMYRGGYYPIYFTSEYFESLWYELVSEINDRFASFIGQPMNTEIYATILHSVNLAIIDFGGRYPDIYKKDFISELDRLEQNFIDKFYLDVDYMLITNRLPHDYAYDLKYDALLVIKETNSIYVFPKYVIDKIKEYSK